MARFNLFVIFTLAFLALSIKAEKKVVNYLGTDFILPGGCPPPPCDKKLRDCRKEHLDMKTKFDECMAEKAAKQGCFTDNLPNGSQITIPVLANFCSKHCTRDRRLEILHECPYEGYIHPSLDPELARQI